MRNMFLMIPRGISNNSRHKFCLIYTFLSIYLRVEKFYSVSLYMNYKNLISSFLVPRSSSPLLTMTGCSVKAPTYLGSASRRVASRRVVLRSFICKHTSSVASLRVSLQRVAPRRVAFLGLQTYISSASRCVAI
jgi:hypothetical protein